MVRANLDQFDPLAAAATNSRPTVPTNTPIGPSKNVKPPVPVPAIPVAPPPRQLDPNQIQNLQQQGFSSGLIRAMSVLADQFPLRMWVVDNSSAMTKLDGHRILGNFANISTVPVSRWEEVQDCVGYQAHMAGLFGLPTRFIMLNDACAAPTFSVGEPGPNANIPREIQVANESMARNRPSGPTPLSKHLRQMRKFIINISPMLQREGKTITVVLATEGLPTDEHGNHNPAIVQQFVADLRALEGLPVWVVIRLCTDDEKVFDFYNTIDAQLKLPYDVLDDFFGEAMEVYLRNPWLTYGLPLHRFREMGLRVNVLDKIDEQALSLLELRDLCFLLFGPPQPLPDPTVDMQGFFNAIQSLMSREKQQWNPITKTVTPWIDLNRLYRTYVAPSAPVPPSQQPHQYATPPPPPQTYYSQPQQTNQHHPGATFSHSQRPPQFPSANTANGNQQQHHLSQPPKPSAMPSQVPPNSGTSSKQSLPSEQDLKRNILTQWALQPPQFTNLRPMNELLGNIQDTLPPANGLPPHEYFATFKPLSKDALTLQDNAVLKRAVRKMKFFLHPDKLPHDLTKEQKFCCRQLWDVIADAWEVAQK